jgi:hypothetical protein
MKNLDTKSVLVGAVAMVVLLKFVLPRVAPQLVGKLS